MFEIKVNDVFNVTGRGIVLVGEILNNNGILWQGEYLFCKEDIDLCILVKSIEMINYGTGKEKLNHIGLFTDITSESKARSLIGKRLYKE